MASENAIPNDGVDDSPSAEKLADPSYGDPWGSPVERGDLDLIPGRDFDPDSDPEDDD